jgi:comEA protein
MCRSDFERAANVHRGARPPLDHERQFEVFTQLEDPMLRTLMSLCVIATSAVVFVVPAHAQAGKRTPAAQPEANLPQAAAAVPGVPAKNGGHSTAVINLNTATVTELEALPGVGAKTAARIVDYRQKKGPFKKIEELMNVQGIGEKSFLKLKPQITVAVNGAASPTR